MKEPKPKYELRHRYGKLLAYNLQEARDMEYIFADTVIIRISDGAWINRPLCLDRRASLNAIHNLE